MLHPSSCGEGCGEPLKWVRILTKRHRQCLVKAGFALTAAPRDIWSTLYEHPDLANVLEPEADAVPASNSEELFVHMLIFHLAASYRARKFGKY
jgi:hypothetical protein